MSNIKCGCYKCRIEVDAEQHFISEDGKILCTECSKGIEHCNQRIKDIVNNIQ